jgi:hypothetical protein
MRMGYLIEGAIGFSSSPSWISRVIKWFTKSKWSHCFVVWRVIGPTDDDVLLIEAGEFQVQIVTLGKYMRGNYEFEILNVSPLINSEKKKEADKKLVSKVETLYGWLQLIGFGIVILLRKWFGWKSKKNIWGRGKICSEVVAEYLIDCGIDYKSLCGDKDINLISPEDIYKFLKSRNCDVIMKKEINKE